MKIVPSTFPTRDLSAAHLWMTPLLEVRTGHTNSLSSHEPQVSASLSHGTQETTDAVLRPETADMGSNKRQLIAIVWYTMSPLFLPVLPVKPPGKLWAKIKSLKRVNPSQGRLAAWSSSDGARQMLAPMRMMADAGRGCSVHAHLPPWTGPSQYLKNPTKFRAHLLNFSRALPEWLQVIPTLPCQPV